ncbi:MAG TPA: hypothetical protein VJ717_07210 [Gemmatimonadaceae bacterium]|nr:hypothetical protein [Gemmatimonadaceae bacterium]
MRALICLFVLAACSANGHVKPSWLAAGTAESHFSRDAIVVQRATSRDFTPTLIDRFAAAAKQSMKATPDPDELAALISQFDPIWNPAGNVLPNAVTKYTKRVAIVPVRAARKWAVMVGREPLSAVFSLAAMEGMWRDDEGFNKQVFDRAVAGYERESARSR